MITKRSIFLCLALCFSVVATANAAAAEQKVAADSTEEAQAVLAEEGNTIELLSRAAELAAGGESYPVRVAVCAVLLNRLRDAAFPDTPGEVILQFITALTADGTHTAADYYKVSPDGRSRRAAAAAVRGGDPTRGALYFARSDAVPADIRDSGRVRFEYDGFAFWR